MKTQQILKTALTCLLLAGLTPKTPAAIDDANTVLSVQGQLLVPGTPPPFPPPAMLPSLLRCSMPAAVALPSPGRLRTWMCWWTPILVCSRPFPISAPMWITHAVIGWKSALGPTPAGRSQPCRHGSRSPRRHKLTMPALRAWQRWPRWPPISRAWSPATCLARRVRRWLPPSAGKRPQTLPAPQSPPIPRPAPLPPARSLPVMGPAVFQQVRPL